ncbi:hypothetical protein [Marivirga sp.]|uniref:hypothetical protein n=1 Tax=Marivirga sp. TaxID=2018662 RepID=UPI003DA6E099
MSIVINDTANVSYSSELETIVRTKEERPTHLKVSKDVTDKMGKVIPWGIDNLFPQRALKEGRANGIIATTIDKQSRIAYDQGIEYGIYQETAKGVEFKTCYDPVVEKWLRANRVSTNLIKAYRDIYWFFNAFPEIVLSVDRKTIKSIEFKKAPQCRWSEQDNQGIVRKCYISAEWENAFNEQHKSVIAVDAMNPYDTKEDLLTQKPYKYIYPLSYPTELENFYALADWESVRKSGWLEVATAIPVFKKALFKNQITMKYMIEVASAWWEWKYPDFNKLAGKEKIKIQKKELERFEKFMKGSENAGNSLMITKFSDPQFQKEYPGWTITAIDNKLKSGIHIEDSNEASSHLMYALGMDPTIIGQQPGSQGTGGSGSDKRVAYNIYKNIIKPHQDIVLSPYQFAFEYNEFGRDGQIYTIRSKRPPAEEEKPSKAPTVEENRESDPLEENQQQAS